MKIKVQSIHFTADKKLLQFVEEKVDKLFQFYDSIIDSEVYLRLDKSDNSENKIAEIKINTPGKTLFAKEQCKTFEEATDVAVEALRRQITKHKEKLRGV
ncbi:MAG: ribosome-associated translation inhibitor RaiA [Bacteroidia bacterium]|jgi:putative sigma-54 modulation protein|nr:ribosome-associated translation inhibitor RaiA [Bacteroidota bacterium]MBP9081977.1 ribosome-associated translation inhibitor RaiA [Bacteroidia bacterium]MBK7389459.1 ribosome-associated translation inhibitor RaiA [Bacteroidota bacterium]MBK7970491.1 ribosome-associated translation inhibitor RaiA [Bacteroidota bacterium]MBK8876474.1 ribosome-associated translation inhibitor RaiA [Bacteroidota bacterium]